MRPLRIGGIPVWQLEPKHLNGGAPAVESSRATAGQRARADRNTLIGVGHRLGMTHRRLARVFGLSKTQVCDIINTLEGWRSNDARADEA